MAEPRFADDDDLPRTFRREREAREREQRERDLEQPAPTGHGPDPVGTLGTAQAGASGVGYAHEPYDDGRAFGDTRAVVTRFDVPFAHLVMFSIKAVFAAFPALLILGLLFWGTGEALRVAVPSFKGIHITIWQDQRVPAVANSIEPLKPAVDTKKR